ncbi:hypothetical protein [Rubellimicrobium aerolatum]|uniref:Uncharacterized protein n=1 Tax=Rubellimicrobium aerolatum TaxID=490979 RepID=A0ABW0SBI4_9RHOB|nr:hypothetical protein [Rubellimicrobium aerolatum]MBP1805864.1 hypothetical protein [Rubellimicrobium aerolatum]
MDDAKAEPRRAKALAEEAGAAVARAEAALEQPPARRDARRRA